MTISKRYKHILVSTLGSLSVLLPLVSFAAITTDAQDWLAGALSFLNATVIPILISIEVILFIYGIIRYFMNPDTDRKEGSMFMLWGFISIFVTVAFLGLIFFAQQTLGVGSGGSVNPPQLSERIQL